jgi:hypothetical protein
MKKPLLFLVLALPLVALAQECKLIKQTDVYTKERTISTGFIALDRASLSIDASKTEIDFLFSLMGADKCFTDDSMASIFFVGSKIKQSQRNSGSMNCDGIFHFIFLNRTTTPSMLKKLSTQKIEKIVFTGNNKTETIITFTPEQQQMVVDLATCIVKEAPSLLQ